jgi:hypothetical protein
MAGTKALRRTDMQALNDAIRAFKPFTLIKFNMDTRSRMPLEEGNGPVESPTKLWANEYAECYRVNTVDADGLKRMCGSFLAGRKFKAFDVLVDDRCFLVTLRFRDAAVGEEIDPECRMSDIIMSDLMVCMT